MRHAVALAGLAALIACATVAQAPGDQSQRSIARPDVKVGDSWTYWHIDLYTRREMSFGVTRVVHVNERAIQTVTKPAEGGKELDGIWTPEWNIIASAEDEIFKPHSGWLRFPLLIGTSHSVSYDVIRPRGEARIANRWEKHNGTAKIVGWEKVEVPAGSFRALKIEVDEEISRYGLGMPGGGNAKIFLWYVPQVKRWVKLIHEDWTASAALPARRVNWWAFELVNFSVQ